MRKTISIDDRLYHELEESGALERFKNFSELVGSALKKTVKSIKEENYRKQIETMSLDPMVKEDIERIREDFKYADGEQNAW